MCTRLSAAQHGTALGLHSHHLHVGVVLLECTSHSAHGTTCAHSSHKDVHHSVSILPYLLTCGALVHIGIGGIDKLSQDDSPRSLFLQSVGFLYGTLHALGARGKYQLGTGCTQEVLTLLAHGLGHHDDGLIAFHTTYPCQTHPRIAACGLYDHATGFQDSFLLGIFYHVEGDAVLHTTSGIEKLHFSHHLCLCVLLGSQTLQVHQRRTAYQFGQFLINLCHSCIYFGYYLICL